MTKKENIFSSFNETEQNELSKKIEELTSGLIYISEADAPVEIFYGERAQSVTKEIVLKQTGRAENDPVEERTFADFFSRLTKIQDWFGEREKAAAQRYAELQRLLEDNLRDLKVFRIGRVQIDIYAVGLDKDGRLVGVEAKAVET